ncbi:hypothetical protein PBCV1_a498L [Paramecium bursaria Chlorella virus 1]|uniref:Uncharacterized protein n=1 Tax=Paramecium bursaria Chlorella virus 1 TaxID=10506 RepID=Q98548_PBCV1|nr:hypothetical protein PBCV1_a498L [Paramecium bursaria Chlorella virus 1]AAC96865.1 hypothetical protein [Paramecium bursaria Chlorella virus 1]
MQQVIATHNRIFQFPNTIFKMLQIYLKIPPKIFQNPLPNATNVPPTFLPMFATPFPIFLPTSPIFPPMSLPLSTIPPPMSLPLSAIPPPMSLPLSAIPPPMSLPLSTIPGIGFFILNGSSVGMR